MGIQLKKDIYERLFSMIENAKENTEIECKIDGQYQKKNGEITGRFIHYSEFYTLLEYVSQVFAPSKIQANDVELDINIDKYRVTLIGTENILHFCKTRDILSKNMGTSVIAMTKTRNQKEYIDEYDISVKSSEEKKLEGDNLKDAVSVVLSHQKHTYRIKNRFFMILPKSNLRLDFTIVKMSTSSDKTENLIQMLSNMRESYEVEIEVMNPLQIRKGSKDEKKTLILEMISLMSEFLKVIDDVEYLTPRSQKHSILQNYVNMTFNLNQDIQNILKNSRRLFAGPNLVTFEKKHMLSSPENPINMFAGYTVTLKADGERNLFYINKDGNAYLINSRLSVKYTGFNFPEYSDSLFDCETLTTLYSKKKTILIFDAYFINNKKVASLPLVMSFQKIDQKIKGIINKEKQEKSQSKSKQKGGNLDDLTSRLEHIEEFIKYAEKSINSSKEDTYYSIEGKEFYYPLTQKMSIFDVIKKIIYKKNSKDVNFEVDGLIFTPMFLPVGVDFKSNESIENLQKKPPHFGGTWSSVMKWKPPEYNTIDFLIKEIPGMSIIREGNTYRKFALYCSKKISPFDSTIQFLQSYPNLHNKFVKELFDSPIIYDDEGNIKIDPRHVWIKENEKGVMQDEDGNQILSDTILEVRFDIHDKEWKPLRVRKDKNEIYKMTNNIANTANSYHVCHSIWKTISDPILEHHLIGERKISIDNINLNDNYYEMDNVEKRSETLTFPMKEFHSKWVKGISLISHFKGKIKSLYDPTCGRGGDLFKYIDAQIPIVLGTDLYDQNIYHPKSGANARLVNAIKSDNFQKMWKYVFLPMDFSVPLEKSLSNGKDTSDDKTLLRILWGKQSTSKLPRLQRYEGMATKKFDLINMQFSLHYFFENQNTINSCLDNIVSQMKKGGYFVGTCFDGELIDQYFKENEIDYGQVKSGEKKNTIIWSLRKKYRDDFDPKTSIGFRIGVFVETINNRENDEYLVGFDLLVNELKKRGIRLLTQNESKQLGLSKNKSHGSFEELFDDLLDYSTTNEGKKNMYKIKDALYMSPSEKELSFLYKWFVFKKDD